MQPSVLIAIADGSEEMELVITADVLRRAGANVTIASTKENSLNITAARGLNVVADAALSDLTSQTFDAIVLPGGMPGAMNLRECKPLIAMLERQLQSGRWIAAICAAPAVILQHYGLLEGHLATCHPSFQAQLDSTRCQPHTRVVVDRSMITSQAPGTTFEFALALVEQLCGPEKRCEVEIPLVLPTCSA